MATWTRNRRFYCDVLGAAYVMRVDDETFRRTDGPLQLGPPGQASLYFNDPFGNHLELECLGFSKPIPIRAPDMAQLAWKLPQ